ncbi:hypothetical protein [Serratia ficaria]|uniref:hypothetical protein n=1 Tax=Serratia ficaria TaxID=61651 RepID=UPI000AF2154A|nr:hypothetical protein [Serratia ficaria]
MPDSHDTKSPRRSNDMKISTREFALMLDVPEQELGAAAATTQVFRGMALPAPVSQLRGRTRHFWLSDCLAFAEQLKDAPATGEGTFQTLDCDPDIAS